MYGVAELIHASPISPPLLTQIALIAHEDAVLERSQGSPNAAAVLAAAVLAVGLTSGEGVLSLSVTWALRILLEYAHRDGPSAAPPPPRLVAFIVSAVVEALVRIANVTYRREDPRTSKPPEVMRSKTLGSHRNTLMNVFSAFRGGGSSSNVHTWSGVGRADVHASPAGIEVVTDTEAAADAAGDDPATLAWWAARGGAPTSLSPLLTSLGVPWPTLSEVLRDAGQLNTERTARKSPVRQPSNRWVMSSPRALVPSHMSSYSPRSPRPTVTQAMPHNISAKAVSSAVRWRSAARKGRMQGDLKAHMAHLTLWSRQLAVLAATALVPALLGHAVEHPPVGTAARAGGASWEAAMVSALRAFCEARGLLPRPQAAASSGGADADGLAHSLVSLVQVRHT